MKTPVVGRDYLPMDRTGVRSSHGRFGVADNALIVICVLAAAIALLAHYIL